MKSLFRCLFLGILCFSCVGNETPDQQTEVYGELKISRVQDHLVGVDEFWVVVHDLGGIPIANKRLEFGETMTVVLDDSKRYHLTTYAMDKSGDHQREVLESYTNLSVAEDITLGLVAATAPTPPITGNFEVDVTGTGNLIEAYVTSTGAIYNHLTQQVGSLVEMTMKTLQGVEDYLLVAKNSSGETRYKMLKVTAPDTKLSYKFSDLSPFDKVFKFKKSDFSQFQFTSVELQKTETEFKNGYIVNSNQIGINFDHYMEYELGFINEIEYYFIGVEGQRSSNPNSYFSYQRIGSVPAAINLPMEQTIHVQSPSVADFRFTKPSGVTNWTAIWDQSDPFNGIYRVLRWSVHGNEPSVKLSLPKEIVDLSPKLQNLSNFKLESNEIITHSLSYDEQIRSILIERPKSQTMERTSIRQSFRQ